MSVIENKSKSEIDWASLSRELVPDSKDLQERIIVQAREVPQMQNLLNKSSYLMRFVRSFRVVLQPEFRPLAIGCAVAIVSVVLLKTPELGELQSVENDNTLVFDAVGENTAIMDQASWDELILMQDELAFSDFH